MAEELPSVIDIRRLLDGQRELGGIVRADRLSRLPEPYRAAAPVRLDLAFEPLADNRVGVGGRVSSTVNTICQRCLNEMRIDVAREINVVLVEQEPTAAEAEEPDDFVVVEDGQFPVAAFAEDELILACPMVPLHPRADCPVQLDEAVKTQEKRKPFAGLADLLADKSDRSGE